MIRLFRRDGVSFDAEDLVLGVAVEEDGEEKLATFPWTDVTKIVLDGGAPAVADTDFNGMPLRVLAWKEEASGLLLQLPLPVKEAEEVGRAMAGMKVQVATQMPPEIWTP